ncbi:MAG: hypothetical protein ACC662_04645, partial [Planctomycetota bacterium]
MGFLIKRLGNTADAEDLALLRRYLPETLAWHDVFASPFPAEEDARLAARLEQGGPATVHELAAALSLSDLAAAWRKRFGEPSRWLALLPAGGFPREAPLVRETPYGRIALGTPGDDVYSGEFAVLIDPGGDDRYVGCRLGAAFGTKRRRAGFFADLAGDDDYASADVNVTLGAAILGIAAFYDLGAGNDRYRGGHASLGAAMGGRRDTFMGLAGL